MQPPELAHRLHRACLHQAATRLAIRHNDNAAWVQDFGRFRHEPNTAEGNYIAGKLARLSRQFQAVAYHVGQFLNLRLLVMVRQQNRPALVLQFQNLFRDGSS
jgi:hypothetical protein